MSFVKTLIAEKPVALISLKALTKLLTTVKILKTGTPEIIIITVLQMEQLDFTVQYCVQKMQTEKKTEKTLIRLLHEEQSDLGLHCFAQTYLSQYLKLLR